MTPKRCFKWGAIALAIFVVYGALMPALTGPRTRLIVDYSISLFLLMFMLACSWQATKLERPKKTYAITLFVCALLGSAMFLFRLSQIPK